MVGGNHENGAPTRRDYIKYGGAVVGGGLLAGCTTDGETATGTDGQPAGSDDATGTQESDTPYSVSMSPMGTVEFESVPEKAVSFDDQWVDHMVALGQGDKLVGLGRPDRYFTHFYERLPGVSFDTEGVTPVWNENGFDSEAFFKLDADIHHLDPVRAVQLDGLDEQNVERIRENLGPFFANRGSRAHNVPGSTEADYQFYSLWEILSKFAEAYQVQDRSAALRSVRDEMVANIQSELPPESERPTVALAQFWEGKFYVYSPNKAGFGSAHTRPVELKDALPDVEGYAASNWQSGIIDVEAMAEADPDVFIYHNAVGIPDYYEKERKNMKDGEVTSEITAVQNDRIYPGGFGLQGPIYNLFQIEMTAKQVYPDLFGEYPGLREPVPEGERLFDRQRVADIVNGDI